MIFKDVDTGKSTTETFPMSEGDPSMTIKWKKAIVAHNNRAAGVLINGSGVVKQFAYTSIKTGVNSRFHPSDVLLAQWA